MKIYTRKRVGVVLMIAAPVVGLLLYFAGVRLLSLVQSQTSYSGSGFVTASEYKMHWPLLALIAAEIIGLVLFVIPRHDKTNA
jgi:hypothetical protein